MKIIVKTKQSKDNAIILTCDFILFCASFITSISFNDLYGRAAPFLHLFSVHLVKIAVMEIKSPSNSLSAILFCFAVTAMKHNSGLGGLHDLEWGVFYGPASLLTISVKRQKHQQATFENPLQFATALFLVVKVPGE